RIARSERRRARLVQNGFDIAGIASRDDRPQVASLHSAEETNRRYYERRRHDYFGPFHNYLSLTSRLTPTRSRIREFCPAELPNQRLIPPSRLANQLISQFLGATGKTARERLWPSWRRAPAPPPEPSCRATRFPFLRRRESV